MRPRRRRRPKVSPSEIVEESSDEDPTYIGNEGSSDEEEQSEGGLPLKRAASSSLHRNRKILKEREDMKEEPEGWPADKRRRFLAFCCAKCKCSDEHKEKFKFRPEERYVQTSMDHYFHRRCCHALDTWEFNSAIPNDHTYQKCMECREDMLLGEEPEFQPPEPTEKVVKKKYVIEKAQNLVDQVRRDDNKDVGSADPVQALTSNPEYMANLRRVRELPKHQNRGIKVLSLFSGCGTAEVVLKKLGIKIDSLVICEADKVAAFVCKEHHDVNYHVRKFEELVEYPAKLDILLEQYGPFDLVVGGPPCIDYSGANARRQGTRGTEGSYMLHVGKLIKRIQQHERQRGVHVHFLIENVRIQQQKEVPYNKTDLRQIERHFGITWHVELDAVYFSPCRRLRYFFTNIPVDGYNFGLLCSKNNLFNPQTCLNPDGFHLASHFFKSRQDDIFQTKVNTFMASKSRLDDPRMEVFKKNEKKKYCVRTITATERSHLMGYPEGYFAPVDTLFQTLRKVFEEPHHKAGDDGQDDRHHWDQTLEPKYQSFKGAYNGNRDSYNLKMDHEYRLYLEMAPPGHVGPTGKPSEMYGCEQYKKRLIGNAFSIPVMEHLLKPLCNFFATENYEGYDYNYKWQQSASSQSKSQEDGEGVGFPGDALEGEESDHTDTQQDSQYTFEDVENEPGDGNAMAVPTIPISIKSEECVQSANYVVVPPAAQQSNLNNNHRARPKSETVSIIRESSTGRKQSIIIQKKKSAGAKRALMQPEARRMRLWADEDDSLDV